MVRTFLPSPFVRGTALLCLAMAGVSRAGAAQGAASLTGKVSDPSGNAVPQAQATLTGSNNHSVRRAITDGAGRYNFPSLPAGVYSLTVEANNFARYSKQAVQVSAPEGQTIDIRLQLSSVSQSVTVHDDHESFQEIATLGKTETRLEDTPASVQIISRKILAEQGATMLRQSMANASGVNYGGQDSKGFYDHFLIRGLNATIYSDNFTDGDQLGGVSHSLNGVEHVEVLEGPGSALFGSGAPGGTISLVHYTPSSMPHYGISLQGGSFGTVTNEDFATGGTGIAGLSYRVDATFSHSNGFRDLHTHDYEVRPSLEWQLPHHVLDFAVDARHIHDTPDSYGIIYFNGSPITGVSRNAKYSTPFAFANQPFVRPTIADTWQANRFLIVNTRFSFLHRTLDSLGNGDSTSTKVSNGSVINRQLRKQNDDDNFSDLQFEPVWSFSTGSIHHHLLTGFEYLHQTLETSRTSADLPNIADAFHPVPLETSAADVLFLCDAKHSCDNDHLSANYTSLYATDQVDVTDRLKLRGGFRSDFFRTNLTPQISVPGRFGTDGQPLLAGVQDTRNDSPVSWNAGVLYKIIPSIVPYFGASRSHLANFNSENTQNGVGAPESATQDEAGIKFPLFSDRIALNTAVFHVEREHVATLVTIDNVETIVFDSQRTRGFEASFDGKLMEQWHLLANVTYQNPVITVNETADGPASVGNRPQGAPAHMANLWTTYNFSVAGQRGFQVGAGLNYLGRTFSDITNVNHVPSYVIGNATVGFDRGRWGLHLNGDNLTDRRYFLAGNAAGAYEGNSAAVYGKITLNLGSHE